MKLKLQYFGHLTQRANSLKKTLMLGKIEDRRRRGQQRMRWLDGITDLMDMSLSKLREMAKRLACCSPWDHKELDKTEQLNNSNLVCASQVVLVTKNLPASLGDAEDTGLISRLRRSPIKGNGNQFQYSCLENSMDRGDWRATVRRSTELSDMTEYTHTT